MLQEIDTNVTLPSRVAICNEGEGLEELALTLVFHPDINRIGERATVPDCTVSDPWTLGRYSPDFSLGQRGDGAPLRDRHVSRSALQLTYDGDQLLVHRPLGASRCCVANRELSDVVRLDKNRLRAGVPLLLGHTVVLLLRLGRVPQAGCDESTVGNVLRGRSAPMQALREQVAVAAECDLDVLIRGETGTGKELVATAIHRGSRRKEGPMLSVNMAAIPRELAPAALFGTARGAYTGAERSARGYFEQANGGSLFLDEIGDTAAEVQPQLLRVLQEREVQAVGGPIRRVDTRVISATDADIEGQECGFKAALRHRLGACEILVPALRDHPEDVGELLLFFLRKNTIEQERTALLPGKDSAAIDIAAWAAVFSSFVSYRWPGNVRELANAAQQLVLASTATAPLLPQSLRTRLTGADDRSGHARSTARRNLRDIDDPVFDQAMAASGYEPLGVARQLGVSRAAVYRRIEASGGRYRLAKQIPQDELRQALSDHCGSSSAVAAHLGVSLNSLRVRLRQLPLDWH